MRHSRGTGCDNNLRDSHLFGLGLFFACVGGLLRAQPAELRYLRNGKIVTMEASVPEVQALAVRSGKIVAVGTDSEMLGYIGSSTKVIDLAGRLAIPGFIEGHGHFTSLGSSKMELNLRDAKNWDQIVAMVAAAAREAKPGAWILGRGWHQAKWDPPPSPNVQGFPLHEALSKVSPNNPVWLTHASGHAGFANAEAMRLAGVDKSTPNPPGGEILKDSQGNPTGLFNEQSQGLIWRTLADYRAHLPPSELAAEARRQVDLATRECLSKGITTFQDAGSPLPTVDLLKSMAEENKLGLATLGDASHDQCNSRSQPAQVLYAIGAGDDHFTVRAIKRTDGWRSRLARRLDAGAILGLASWNAERLRSRYRGSCRYPQDRRACHRERLSALRARHRRSRQSRSAEHF